MRADRASAHERFRPARRRAFHIAGNERAGLRRYRRSCSALRKIRTVLQSAFYFPAMNWGFEIPLRYTIVPTFFHPVKQNAPAFRAESSADITASGRSWSQIARMPRDL